MSTVKTNKVQVGQSGTSNNNFTVETNLAGAVTLRRGNHDGGGDSVLSVDSAGDVTVHGALIVDVDTGSLGFGTGAGGTVTQATDKTTGVTINKPCGRITTANTALAAGASVSFLVTNDKVGTNDTVLVTTGSGGSNHYAISAGVINGSFRVVLTNYSGSSQSTAVGINFTVVRGAQA